MFVKLDLVDGSIAIVKKSDISRVIVEIDEAGEPTIINVIYHPADEEPCRTPVTNDYWSLLRMLGVEC